MKPPKFVFFDLGNVLLNFDHQIAVQQISKLTGLDPAKVDSTVFQSDLQTRYEKGEVSTDQFVDEFCNRTGVDVESESFLTAASSIFWVNRPIVPLVSKLNLAGVPLGLLSNTCDAHWNYIRDRDFNFLKLIGPQVLSFRVESAKPEEQIFRHAEAIVNVTPGEIFFVDDRQENVQGALQAGWDAVRFESVNRLASELLARGVPVNF